MRPVQLNGNGEMTGMAWVDDSGFLEGPAAITNTHSVGVVRDAIIEWGLRQKPSTHLWLLPVVAETLASFHLGAEFLALFVGSPQAPWVRESLRTDLGNLGQCATAGPAIMAFPATRNLQLTCSQTRSMVRILPLTASIGTPPVGGPTNQQVTWDNEQTGGAYRANCDPMYKASSSLRRTAGSSDEGDSNSGS